MNLSPEAKLILGSVAVGWDEAARAGLESVAQIVRDWRGLTEWAQSHGILTLAYPRARREARFGCATIAF
jgi:hypothetical protein